MLSRSSVQTARSVGASARQQVNRTAKVRRGADLEDDGNGAIASSWRING